MTGQQPGDRPVGDISVVQALLDRPGEIAFLLVDPDQPRGLPPIETLNPPAGNAKRRRWQ